MLNQSISTPVQHPNHNNNGSDLGMNSNYVQQQRQQPSQMSGAYQRPSNGSNILEQHAMRPATTGDPSNCVFNDQESSINGILRNDSLQMQRVQNMMGMQTNPMVSNNMTTGNNQTRLPSLTLSNNNFSSNIRGQQCQQNCQNGHSCSNAQNDYQNQSQHTYEPNMNQDESAQQPQQMSQRSYEQSICQNKLPSMTLKEQQLLVGQQSLNSQQMVTPPRMNTPVLNQQQNIQLKTVQQQNMQQQPVQQQNTMQSGMHQSNVQQMNMQQHNVSQQNAQQMQQKQNRMQHGMQKQTQVVRQQNMQSSNVQRMNSQQQVQQPQHMQQKPMHQHNMQQQNSHNQNVQVIQSSQNGNQQMVQQPMVQQQNMQQKSYQQQNAQQQVNMQQSNIQQANIQLQQNCQQQNIDQQSNMQQLNQQQVIFQQNLSSVQQTQQNHNQMNQQSGLIQQKCSNHLSMGQTQVQNENRTIQSNPGQHGSPSDQMSYLGHMDPPPTQHSMNSVPQSQPQQHSNQINANSTPMMSVQSQVQSPTNMSTTSSPTRLPSLTFVNSNSQPICQSNIPQNANSTTQLLMALNSNSPITAEQLNEIQKMTCIAPDGTEMLLMQEPRLKQYSNLKEMSTQDLRSECKKRSLPTAGTKVKLSERLANHETEVLDERNQQLMMEYSHRQQMYLAQAATLKAFQAKKASLQVQSNQNTGCQAVSSNEISSTTQSMLTITQSSEGPPPAKRKRPTKSKKSQQQQQEKQKIQQNAASDEVVNIVGNDSAIMSMIPNTLIGNIRNIGSVGNNHINQGAQMSSTNIFGNANQLGSSVFMKDNTCYSHFGSGGRLISTRNSEDSQNSYSGSGRFPLSVPPPPEDNPIQFETVDRQNFSNNSEQVSQPQINIQSRLVNLNQQQVLGANNIPIVNCEAINPHISNMFNPSSVPNNQQSPQQNSQTQQQQLQPQSQQTFMTPAQQLQASPCEADQAGSSPNMPVSEISITNSNSPMLVSSGTDNSSYTSSELMDIETMQHLLSPETLRAREELLTQQQTKINELVNLIQKHHDTLREQQEQINLAKRQQKLRQRQNSQTACAIDKHVTSRSLQHVIKSRQNVQVLNELTTQQEVIRTAETRLIEQLHINTATDDIARLIKQDGRTALVIVSLLHDYRTKREQNNQPGSKSGDDTVSDKATEGTKKKAPARKRNNAGKVNNQTKKNLQQTADVEVVQVVTNNNDQAQKGPEKQTDFSQIRTPGDSTSDINMDAIFEIVINPSDSGKNKKAVENTQVAQQHFDNEVISLPSEGSSPNQMQTLNSMQSGFSDGFNTKNIVFHENSPQQVTVTYISHVDSGNSSTYSPDNMFNTQTEQIQQHFSMSKQPETMEILPQLEQHSIDQELGNQFPDTLHFSEDSNQGFFDQNCQNNFDESVMYSETAFDQLVADFQTNPPNCEVDGDLNKILNSLDNFGTDGSNHKDVGQETNELCDIFNQNNSLDMEQYQGFDWNEFNAQSNIINQAFEQSEMQ